MNKRCWIAVLALIGLPAFADDASDAEDPVIRRYSVEMIIFQYAQDVSIGSEVFVPDTPPEPELMDLDTIDNPAEMDDSDVVRMPAIVAVDDLAPDVEAIEFIALQEKDFTLTDIYQRMQRLDVYEPLMHFGWTQATLPQDVTGPRPLASFARAPEGLDGDLTLYLSRYLHLAVNLQLDAPRLSSRSQAQLTRSNVFGDAIREPLRAQPTRFRIVENRIVRNDELRYFDHPKFGVLAKVSRVVESHDDQNGETEQPGITELLDDIPQ